MNWNVQIINEMWTNFICDAQVKGDLTHMWRQAADFHIRNGHSQVAVNSLEELLQSNQGDKKILAQLVLALSQVIYSN